MSDGASCSTCRFWRCTTAARTAGECHRFPPQVVAIPDDDEVINKGDIWPLTSATQWCGEHRGAN